MSLRRLRSGELIVLVGVICLAVSLAEPWYEGPVTGQLDAWDTFGASMVLLLASLCAGLAVVVSAIGERNAALPVSTAVWSTLLGLIGVIAAVVRVLEPPDHASSLCIGAWLALAGAVAMLVGSWRVLDDERPSRYEPVSPLPRPRP
jgi:hypothetical protein